MKQMKDGGLLKNAALEKTNQETCFSLKGPQIISASQNYLEPWRLRSVTLCLFKGADGQSAA